MLSPLQRPSRTLRIFCLFLGSLVFVQFASSGISWAANAAFIEIQQRLRQINPPPPNVDQPIAARRVPGAGREPETRGGWWTGENAAALQRLNEYRLQRFLEHNPEYLFASLLPGGFESMMPGPGSPPGDPLPGEGSAGGGGWGGGFVEIHEHGGPGPDWDGSGGGVVPGPGQTPGPGGNTEPPPPRNQLNTNTGNLLTAVPITGWSAKGYQGVEFTLIHNSRANTGIGTESEFGGYWSHSYNHRVYFDKTSPGTGDRGIVVWADGLHMPFTYSSGTEYDPPPGIHATLTRAGNTAQLLTKDGWTYNFYVVSKEGVLSSVVDPFGNTVTVNRGAFFPYRIESISDGLGRSITIDYGVNLTPTNISGPNGQSWSVGFQSSSGNVTSIVHNQSTTTVAQFAYWYNKISSLTDARGKVWSYTYDNEGKLLTATNPLAKTWSYSYSSNTVSIINPLGGITLHLYANGLITSVIDEQSHAENYWSDADRNLTHVQDRRGNHWYWTYDGNGNALTAKDPNNNTYTYTYNADNNLTGVTDPLGHDVTLSYAYPNHGHFYRPWAIYDDNGTNIGWFDYNSNDRRSRSST